MSKPVIFISILGGVEDENVEIISCDAAEAIKKFKSGELESSSDLKGEQITEAVEDGITKNSLFKYMTVVKWNASSRWPFRPNSRVIL